MNNEWLSGKCFRVTVFYAARPMMATMVMVAHSSSPKKTLANASQTARLCMATGFAFRMYVKWLSDVPTFPVGRCPGEGSTVTPL